MSFRVSFFNNQIFKDVSTLFSGSVIAQFIGFAFLPVLTRLFLPEEFGVFYLFLTTASILSLIATGGYEKSFVLTKSDNDARHLLLFSLLLSAVVTILSFLIILFLQQFGDKLFQSGQNRLILWLIPVYSYLFGLFRIFQNWSIRNRNFKMVSGSNIIRSGSLSVLQSGFGLVNAGAPGLISGSCLSQVFSLLFLIRKEKETIGKFSKESLRAANGKGKEYRSFPFFKMPSDLLNEVSIQLPVYVIATFFSNAITGIYTFPQKIMSQPSKFISQAVGEVYYRRASEIYSQNKDLSDLSFKTFKTLFITGIVPFVITMLWGQEIFAFVFSKEWEQSGKIAALLSPWILFVFAGSPVTYIFLIKRKLRLSFILNLILLLVRATALLTGCLIFKDLEITVILFAGVSFIYWIWISFYSLHLCGVNTGRALFFTVSVILITLVPLGLLKLFIW